VLARGWVTGSYAAVSDFDGPYGPVDAPPPGRYRYGYGYERAPIFLPAVEVYAVLRENGFSPLGAPHLRGDVYLISALDRRGDDGQLVIDARDGRILRFVPADVVGSVHEQRSPSPYGARAALPLPNEIRSGPPRPPAAIPHVASRTIPIPRQAPPRGEAPALAAQPASAAEPPARTKAAEAPQSLTPAVEAKPAAPIQPTREMPPAQGFE
jgi:hypothetical protein